MGETLENNAAQNNAKANSNEPGDNASEAVKESLGRRLRAARERLGLSVADVANQIKFAPRQIEALEADDYKHLQGAAFLRGFVRSYAKILSVDMQSLRKMLPENKVALKTKVPPSVEEPFPTFWSARRGYMIWLGVGLLSVVIIMGLASNFFSTPPVGMTLSQVQPETKSLLPAATLEPPAEIDITPASVVQTVTVAAPESDKLTVVKPPVAPEAVEARQVAQPVASQVTSPVPVTSLVQPGLSTAGTKLRMVFGKESWVEILDKDERRLTSQLNPAGSQLNFEGKLPLSLVIGHANAVALYRDGAKVDLTPHINKFSEVARLTLE